MAYSKMNNRNSNKPQREINKQFFLVRFESKEDLLTLAHCILFEKNLKINNRKIHMMLHNKKGNYNSKTTICIGQLNPMCNEKEIVEELNIVLRDERNKNETPVPEKPRNFILSSIVFWD